MKENFESIKRAVEFYISQGFRPMPVYSVEDKCKHRPVRLELDCKGQCWGKVPSEEHWPDKDVFDSSYFTEESNLALIMGKQLDGRWFVGFDIDGHLDLSYFLQLPPTLECISQRGKHLIYEVEPDSPLGNWNDILSTRSKSFGYKLDYRGALDIKYCRGAMVSPPSKTKSGNIYQWSTWREVEKLPISEQKYLIRKRKSSFPEVKTYSKWSMYPTHFDKRA